MADVFIVRINSQFIRHIEEMGNINLERMLLREIGKVMTRMKRDVCVQDEHEQTLFHVYEGECKEKKDDDTVRSVLRAGNIEGSKDADST